MGDEKYLQSSRPIKAILIRGRAWRKVVAKDILMRCFCINCLLKIGWRKIIKRIISLFTLPLGYRLAKGPTLCRIQVFMRSSKALIGFPHPPRLSFITPSTLGPKAASNVTQVVQLLPLDWWLHSVCMRVGRISNDTPSTNSSNPE